MRPLSLREAVTVFRSELNNPTSNTSQPIAPICRRTASKVLPMVARPRRPDEAPVLEGGGDGIPNTLAKKLMAGHPRTRRIGQSPVARAARARRRSHSIAIPAILMDLRAYSRYCYTV